MRRHLEFLLLAVIALTSLAIGAAHLPQKLRSLFPTPLAYGALAGVALGFLARSWGLARSRRVNSLVALLVVAALVGVVALRWRLESRRFAAEEWAEARLRARDDRQAAVAAQAASARGLAETYQHSPDDDPETRKKIEQFLAEVRQADENVRGRWTDDAVRSRVAEQTSLWNFLNRRRSRLERWKAPWPAIVTLVETTLGAGLALLIFRSLAVGSPPPLAAATPPPLP